MAGKALAVKLGGSLSPKLPDLIPVLRSSPVPLLIIPGGGVFADAVRDAHLIDDTAAHWMAVAAMDHYGLSLESLGLECTRDLAVPERTSVLRVYCTLRKIDPLPHSWDVTSDTIAAWVAGRLGLDLLVLKSVDGIMVQGHMVETVNTPLETDTVDASFLPFVLEKKIQTTVINGTRSDRVVKYLNGEDVFGTRIGTTF